MLEILGTAFSVGCQVDGKSPKDISDGIKSGEIEGSFSFLVTVLFFSIVRVLYT